MQASIHDNDLSTNSKLKAKRGRKGIINKNNEDQMQSYDWFSFGNKKKNFIINAASLDYSIHEKRLKTIKEIAEKLETTEAAVSRKKSKIVLLTDEAKL